MKKRCVLIYGSFKEPYKKHNFIVVRIPDGRCPWSKKIAPAIHRLVKPWLIEAGSDIYEWYNEGEPDGVDYWNTTNAIRYDWDGEKLVKQS